MSLSWLYSSCYSLLSLVLTIATLIILMKILSISSHLLMVLLVLELFTLTLLTLMVFSPLVSPGGALLLVVVFTLAVGEASLGLSLLVLSARNIGNDSLALLQ